MHRSVESPGYFSFIESAPARVERPIARARGLPGRAYTDPESLEHEFAQIFFRGWTCIGFAKDIAEPGDARPVSLIGRPLLMLRDRDGAVRVFHNVCSHRGMTLLEAPTRRLRALRCPYHHWCYDLSGRLRATPHIGGPGVHDDPAFDRDDKGLTPVRSAVWFDLVFVDLSGGAPAFESFIAPLAERWRAFADTHLVHGGVNSSDRLEVAANWKLAVENYCEAYHLPAVHPDLNRYSRLEDHYAFEAPGRYAGQGTRLYQPTLSEDGRSLPSVPGLAEPWRNGAEYVALFPNLLLGLHRDHFFAVRLDPVAVDKTVEELEIYYFGHAAIMDNEADLRRANRRAWRQVFDEDVRVVEGMQKGRASPAFDGGAFSPAMDGPTHGFHKWVAGRLSASAADPTTA